MGDIGVSPFMLRRANAAAAGPTVPLLTHTRFNVCAVFQILGHWRGDGRRAAGRAADSPVIDSL